MDFGKIVRHNAFNISDYDFGSAYFVLASPGQLQPLDFSSKTEICFINCPYKEAIKVPYHIKKIGKRLVNQLREEIQNLISYDVSIDYPEHFDDLITTLCHKFKNYDTIVLEDSGLCQENTVRLMRFCMEISEQKKIFIIDASNVLPDPQSDIAVYKISQQFFTIVSTLGLNNFTGRSAKVFFGPKRNPQTQNSINPINPINHLT
jgi:hypothetical protein